MTSLWRMLNSTVGKKFLMAVSGVALFVFVTGHMIGNLQLFLGPEALNRYAHFLQSLGEILWLIRFGLLGLILLHIWSALSLAIENKAARPVDYSHNKPPFAASLASRTMLIGGGLVALFVVYHLLHFTVRLEAVNGTEIVFADLRTAEGHPDVYGMVVAGFRVWYVSLIYVIAVGFLCLHLSHGASAMFQSLGLRNHAWWPAISKGALIWSAVLFLGYAAIPGAVLLGYGRDYVENLQSQVPAVTESLSKEAHS
jgi:succinate dehydrogenase / fumarate reductase cytochrome b subunit